MQRLTLFGFAFVLLLIEPFDGLATELKFGSPRIYLLDSGAASIAVGDLSGDGVPDIVVPNVYAATVSILINDHNGGFDRKTNLAVAGGPWSAVITDFTGDGRNDVLVNHLYGDGRLRLLRNNGSGVQFSQTDTGLPSPFSFISADINNDGLPDLITADYSLDGVSLILASSPLSFGVPSRTHFPPFSYPFAVASADFNHDGFPDVVCVNNGDATVNVLLGNGTSVLSPVSTARVPSSPTFVMTGDIDEDGIDDVVTVQSGSCSVFRVGLDGLLHHTETFAFDCIQGRLIDIDADQHLDFVTLTSKGFAVLRGTGRGTFHHPRTFSAPDAALDNLAKPVFSVSDFNSDGLADFAVLNHNATVAVFDNNTRRRTNRRGNHK